MIIHYLSFPRRRESRNLGILPMEFTPEFLEGIIKGNKYMSYKLNFNSMIIIVLFVQFCIFGCQKNNLIKLQKEEILKDRVAAMYSQWKNNNVESRYDFLWPELKKIIDHDFYMSTGPYIQVIEDYKIESLEIDGDFSVVILQIKYKSNNTVKDWKNYSFWVYSNANWYIIDDVRSKPYSKNEIEQFKKMIREGVPPELIEEIKSHQKAWAEKRRQ